MKPKRLTVSATALLCCLVLCLTLLGGCFEGSDLPADESSGSGAQSESTGSTGGTDDPAPTDPTATGESSTTARRSSARTTTASTTAPTRQTRTRQTEQTTAAPKDKDFRLIYPAADAVLTADELTVRWEKAADAVNYTVKLEVFRTAAGEFSEVGTYAKITDTEYTVKDLIPFATYRWSVTAVDSHGGYHTATDTAGNPAGCFLIYPDYRDHPANKNTDFTFSTKIDRAVLERYLSRGMTATLPIGTTAADTTVRMLLATGTKYVSRAMNELNPGAAATEKISTSKKVLAAAHRSDPTILFEAALPLYVSSHADGIAVPPAVLRLFEQKVTAKRYFRYEDMLFADKSLRNQGGPGISIPDITRVETQMFFYYLATLYIDAGYEALYLDALRLIGQNDVGWKATTRLNDRIRAYGRQKARRHIVLLTGQTVTDANGKLMFDFGAYPTVPRLPDDAVPHTPDEDHPQETLLEVGFVGRSEAVYTNSPGGTTYSGWTCKHLPYFTELESTGDCSHRNAVELCWGYDEISWFANQPAAYRAQWLTYAVDWLAKNDKAGHLMIPGVRNAEIYDRYNRVSNHLYTNFTGDFSADWAVARKIFEQHPLK